MTITPISNPKCQMSINKMLETALEDRVSSRKEVKNLKFTLGRLSTQYQHALWMRRLQIFRSEFLGSDLITALTGEHLERFLTSMLDKVQPKNPHDVPSFSWMSGAMTAIV